MADCDYSARPHLVDRQSEPPHSDSAEVGSKPHPGLREVKGEPPKKTFSQAPYVVTCYNCGEQGHIRPNCPLKVKPKNFGRVITDSEGEDTNIVSGVVNGRQCPIVLDPGADFSVAPADLVGDDQLTDEFISIKTFRNEPFIRARVAQLNVEVLGQSFTCTAALVPDCTHKLLLGMNIGMKHLCSLLNMKLAEPKIICETRLQARRRREDELLCQQKDLQDGAVAHLDTPTAVVEQEAVEPEADEPEQSADDEDDLPSLPVTAEGQDEQVPLPTLDTSNVSGC